MNLTIEARFVTRGNIAESGHFTYLIPVLTVADELAGLAANLKTYRQVGREGVTSASQERERHSTVPQHFHITL
jgi:hypothetical protein